MQHPVWLHLLTATAALPRPPLASLELHLWQTVPVHKLATFIKLYRRPSGLLGTY